MYAHTQLSCGFSGSPRIILGQINSGHRWTLQIIPLILLGTRQEDHTVNEYAEQDHGEVRGLWGRAVGTGANIPAYNDVTFILDHWTIDWLRLLIQPVFILSAGGHTM